VTNTSRIIARAARRRWVIAIGTLVVAAALVATAQSQTPPTPQTPQFRAGVDVFQFEVTVLDQAHRPVHGLQASDFAVFEEGKPQPIVGFSEVVLPESEGPIYESQEEVAPDVTQNRYVDKRLITIVLDDWGLPADAAGGFQLMSDSRAVARRIVDSLGLSDFAAVVLTRDTRFYPDFTSDRGKLTGYIASAKTIPRDSAERQYLCYITRGHIGGLPALQDVVENLSKLPEHRKLIIYISIGGISGCGDGSANDRALDVYKTAREAGIPIYPIDPVGLSMARTPDFLLTLAEQTGGTATINRNDFLQAVPQIFEETQSYYLLGFQRTGQADGRYRRLDVHVNRIGLKAYSRTGYTAPGKPDMVKGAPVPYDGAVDEAVKAILKNADARRLYTYAVPRPGALRVATEISSLEFGTMAWNGGADVEIKVTRGSGAALASARARIQAGHRGVLVDVPLVNASGQPIDPGDAPLHVNVTATNGSQHLDDGSDAITPGAWLGPAGVYRANSGPRAPLEPVAEFEFLRTERLHIEWPELKTPPEIHTRLLRPSGEALNVELPPTGVTRDGLQMLSIELPLASIAPGEYVIEMVAGEGSNIDRRLVAFRVRQ
jgi:VWFA-related protein